jgi:hypothetical protein
MISLYSNIIAIELYLMSLTAYVGNGKLSK